MATNSNIKLNAEKDGSNRNISPGIQSPGLFAKWPVIGIGMLLLGVLVFGALTYNVEQAHDSLLQWDMAATRTLHADLANIPSSLLEYVIFSFFLGKEIVIAIALILAIYFVYKRSWRELAMLVIGLGGGALLWYFLSHSLDRPRPPGQLPILPLTDPSFPSGLAVSAVLCYGFLAYLLIPRVQSRVLKWLLGIVAVLVIVFIGLSSILRGDNYVTDVLAGYALGLAWAGLVYTLMERNLKEAVVRRQQIPVTSASYEGLRSPGWFRKWPVFGLLVVLAGVLSFAALGYNLLSHGPLLQVDTTVYKDLIAKAKAASPGLNEIMTFGFFVGKQLVLIIVTSLCIYFIYKRYWLELALILISSAVGSIVWNFIIHYFARPRPPDQTGLVVKSIPSFPSGHTMSTLIVYGFLAYLLIPRMPSLFWKWVVGIAALATILFVGLSRVFQGGHYLTDAIGGYALGLAWAGLVFLVIENVFQRRKV
ncbi:MAG: phosphatase PAP2 family protein [Bacteroidota bacterium]